MSYDNKYPQLKGSENSQWTQKPHKQNLLRLLFTATQPARGIRTKHPTLFDSLNKLMHIYECNDNINVNILVI